MKPRIFPEQTQRLHQLVPQEVSFEDYKIDYSQLLGTGCYGRVYALTVRPANEKNVFSRWLPYIYDRIYPAKSNGERKYCVKISYFFIESVINNSSLSPAANALWEKDIQNKSTSLRYQYGISRINVYSTYSWYSQVKSRVNGHTLHHYMESGELIDEKNYLMRKAFIDFLWAIASAPLLYDDLHAKNIMYDQEHQQWEIVDGSTQEDPGYRTAKKRASVISILKLDFMGKTPAGGKNKSSHILLNILVNKAIETVSCNEFSNCNYDKFTDHNCLLKALREAKTPNEFHFFNPAKASKKFAPLQVALLRKIYV